jgi:hypothetical protein
MKAASGLHQLHALAALILKMGRLLCPEELRFQRPQHSGADLKSTARSGRAGPKAPRHPAEIDRSGKNHEDHRGEHNERPHDGSSQQPHIVLRHTLPQNGWHRPDLPRINAGSIDDRGRPIVHISYDDRIGSVSSPGLRCESRYCMIAQSASVNDRRDSLHRKCKTNGLSIMLRPAATCSPSGGWQG